MPDTSPRLELPYLQPSQAQKHVTHNAALQRLDALVQLTLKALDAETPPVTPGAGDMHGLGSTPSAAWAGQAGQIALWDGTVWQFIAPQEGWRAFDLGTGSAILFEGGVWRDELDDLQNLTGVGIGTSSDALNRLAVASDASLFSHAGTGHQMKINKAGPGDTASLLFQSDWTGHAEMGLAGDTVFSVKISADGSTWNDALRLDPTAQDIALAPAATVRARLSDTQLQLDVPITGTAAQASDYDTTAGRVLKVGAGGLLDTLNSLSGDLFDSDNLTAFYYARPVGSSGAADMPFDANWNALKIERGGGFSAALAIHQTVAASSGFWWNTKHSGTVGDWRRIFDTGNLLGTVSQSGGDPTGAVIEAGSNANGDYVRFADGTQICWYVSPTLTTNSYSVNSFWASPGTIWTYPTAFIAAPTLAATAQRSSGAHFHWASISSGGWSQLGCGLYLMAGGTTSTGEIHAVAHGRWF